jgi:Type II transport protein GspH
MPAASEIRKHRDFLSTMSLLESCATIVIVSTFVVFTAPSLIRARENYQLESVARQVAGKMQWTRIKAISRNNDCRIRVTSQTTYAIECQNPDWLLEETIALPRSFRITANATPEFHSRGNVAPAATFIVWDMHSKTRRVVVNITGRVRVD